MKVKYILIVLLSIMTLISISQTFSIPPFSEDVFHVYKSGYFSELDKGFDVIKDSFIGIKMMSKPVYGWIFLEDIEKKYNIDIKVYNGKGVEILAPGDKGNSQDEKVTRILNSLNSKICSEVAGGKYYSAIPVLFENRCRFCHSVSKKKKIIGVMTFERKYDSHIYYSSERIIIFTLISFIFSVLLFFVIKWDPESITRELFDK